MSLAALALLLGMGALAGVINAAVGSGSLLTLPVLLAIGLPPGTAVRTNTIGMMFSTIGSVLGYRREIAAEREHRLGPLLTVTLLGAATGSCLLLISPPGALTVVVPVLIVLALALVLAQPRITRSLRARRARRAAAGDGTAVDGTAVDGAAADGDEAAARLRSPGLLGSMGAASLYGGYFTAAQGILYLGILGAFTGRDMKSVNAIKNLLSLIVNITAATVYLIAFWWRGAAISWPGVAAIAIGSLVGGFFGSHLAKSLPEKALRAVIVIVALAALLRQIW